jgi:methyltransferase
MDLKTVAYLGLLVAVAAGRFVELAISRRNQRRLAAQGARKIREAHFRWMVLLHSGVLVAAGLEVVLLHRPFIRGLALAMSVLFVLANVLRWWVIRTMSGHWNVQVMAGTHLGIITAGPFRWIRHPNYVAVTIELIALPLIHTAWITATLAAVANACILHHRLAIEEGMLLADPQYRAVMGPKPRFLPRLFRRA